MPNLAESILGKIPAADTDEKVSAETGYNAPADRQYQFNDVDGTFIKPYKSPYLSSVFRDGDFQIGSIILPVPPSGLRVHRLRDVQTVPILRGQSITARQGMGVVTIDMTIDFPDYTDRDGPINPLAAMIAEFKVCPFTVIRNRDLSSKVSQIDISPPPKDITDALTNIRSFNQAEANVRKIISEFLVPLDSLGNTVVAKWQQDMRLRLDNIIARIAAFPYNYLESAIDPEDELYELSKKGESSSNLVAGLRQIFESAEDGPDGRAEFDSKRWDKWEKLWRSNEHNETLEKAFTALIKASAKQRAITESIRKKAAETNIPKPPVYVPVVLQRMVLSTVPGSPGRARVDMSFELFNYTAYVSELKWHHFDEIRGLWSYTDNPGKADLLLRWRDQQFLASKYNSTLGFVDMSAVTVDELNSVQKITDRGTAIGNTVPGYLKYMRAAWRNRRSKTPSSDPKRHKLELFYPDTVPTIKSSVAQPVTNFYRKLELDVGDSSIITSGVQIVWNLSIARQTDEYTGLVTHQFVGGSQISANFDITIPIPKDAFESGAVEIHEQKIREINKLFSSIDQNRKILPSDAYQPTSIFVKHPLTELFGAYVFEAGDLPVTQTTPGRMDVRLQLVETLPVVGLGADAGAPTNSRSQDGLFSILLNLWYILNSGVLGSHNALLIAADAASKSVLRSIIPKPTAIEDVMKLALIENRVSQRDVDGVRHLVGRQVVAQQMTEFRKRWERTVQIPSEFKKYVNDSQYAMLIIGLNYLASGSTYTIGGLPRSPLDVSEQIFIPNYGFIKNPLWVIQETLFSSTSSVEQTALLYLVTAGYFSNDEESLREAIVPILDTIIATDTYQPGLSESVLEELHKVIVLPSLTLHELRELLADEDERDINADLVRTAQLYPDLVLPTFAELFNISPREYEGVPDDHLLHFMPSYIESGILTLNRGAIASPARRLSDIVDPDIWFYRDIPSKYRPSEIKSNQPYNTDTNEVIVQEGETTPKLVNGSPQSTFSESDTQSQRDLTDLGRLEGNHILTAYDLQQDIKPNNRRMLFAFPTYSVEYTLEGTNFEKIYQSSALPVSFEARLLNTLPLIRISASTDLHRPNITEIQFVARKSAIRNESWYWLSPDVPIDSATFTNSPTKVAQLIDRNYSLRGDPNFIARTVFSPGTRVSVRLGYGTDLNNDELLPVITSGVIGEVALGEVSSMVIQDIGMQMLNPVETTIGGGGIHSPNRIWNGRLTMRAFIDIFHALDTRFMGRSGRGIENDLPGLTEDEIRRFRLIASSTRTVSETFVERITSGSFRSMIHQFLGTMTPFGVASPVKSLDSLAALASPSTRFFPELLNVYPNVTGISDWGISNTEANSLPGVFWVDMIARLNPGSCWWIHPFGNEARLFFGRPEQLYRKYPLRVSGTKAGRLLNNISKTSSMGLSSTQIELRVPDRFARYVFYNSTNILEAFDFTKLKGNARVRPLGGSPWVLTGQNLTDEFDEVRSRLNDDDFMARVLGELLIILVANTKRESDAQLQVGYDKIIDYYLSAVGTPDRVGATLKGSGFDRAIIDLTPEGMVLILRSLTEAGTKFEAPDIDSLPKLPYAGDVALLGTIQFLPIAVKILHSSLDNPEITQAVLELQRAGSARLYQQYALGFRRFRQYHHAVSGQQLLTNRLIASQAKMANSVTVDGYTVGYNVIPFDRRVMNLDGDIEKLNFGVFQWFKGLFGENDRDKILGILIPNALAGGMGRMYDGQIQLRGNPQLKPHDVVSVLDLHNGLYGPIKVAGVVHTLDASTGFTSSIRPELLTQSFSSRVLTEHVVSQRIMKTIATVAVIGGIASFAAGGPGGVVLGVGLLFSAASIDAYAKLADNVGRRSLTNYSPADALRNAGSSRQVQAVIEGLLLDTYIASDKVEMQGPIDRIHHGFMAKMTNDKIPDLGVNIFPLMKIGSYTPLVVGMRSQGVEDPFIAALKESTEPVSQYYDFLSTIVDRELSNFRNGWNAIWNGLEREIERNKQAEGAIRGRLNGE